MVGDDNNHRFGIVLQSSRDQLPHHSIDRLEGLVGFFTERPRLVL